MKKNIIFLIWPLLALQSCYQKHESVPNPKQGALKASYTLASAGEKSFPLDQYTAPGPHYIQLQSASTSESLSLLNHNNGKIYFYDYQTGTPGKSIDLRSLGIQRPESIRAYHLTKSDSLYLYDEGSMQVHRMSLKSRSKDSISMIGGMNISQADWTIRFPQYQPSTSSPFLECSGQLLLTGMHPWALPDSTAKKLALTSKIAMGKAAVEFVNRYPSSHYASHFEWDDPIYTSSYSDISHDPEKIVISFPISHELFLSDIRTGKMEKVYAGSNFAGNITSMGKRQQSDNKYREKLSANVIANDIYSAVKYDRYRKIYYRFIRRSLQGKHAAQDWKSKTLAVIIMDTNFAYLGETDIGILRDWNPDNSFVTSKGLNIEYVDSRNNDESRLRFKLFAPQKI